MKFQTLFALSAVVAPLVVAVPIDMSDTTNQAIVGAASGAGGLILVGGTAKLAHNYRKNQNTYKALPTEETADAVTPPPGEAEVPTEETANALTPPPGGAEVPVEEPATVDNLLHSEGLENEVPEEVSEGVPDAEALLRAEARKARTEALMNQGTISEFKEEAAVSAAKEVTTERFAGLWRTTVDEAAAKGDAVSKLETEVGKAAEKEGKNLTKMVSEGWSLFSKFKSA